jgi:hypothetical protein
MGSCNSPHFPPAQYGTDAGKHLSEAERLYDGSVRTEFETDDAIDFVGTMSVAQFDSLAGGNKGFSCAGRTIVNQAGSQRSRLVSVLFSRFFDSTSSFTSSPSAFELQVAQINP